MGAMIGSWVGRCDGRGEVGLDNGANDRANEITPDRLEVGPVLEANVIS